MVAVFDWEMATIGDPLTDLGYALMYWIQAGDSELRQLAMEKGVATMAEGFMTRDELAYEYERRSGRPIRNVQFYLALAHYKLGIIIEGIRARYLAGETRGEGFDDMGYRVPELIQLGLEAANESSDAVLRGER